MVSNQNGRALEYVFTAIFQRKYPQAALDVQAISDQQRDKSKYDGLTTEMQNLFVKAASYYVDNIFPKGNVTQICRLPDSAARNGDVTDIRLWYDNQTVHNISLKRNHTATKHPRPGGIPKQIGLSQNEEQAYKAKIKRVENDFFTAAPQSFSLFSDVKSYDSQIITNLYASVCNIVIDTINSNPQIANTLLTFLIGNTGFEKVVVYDSNSTIESIDFRSVPIARNVAAYLVKSSYVALDFDNGYRLQMRLHTASSKFERGKSLDLKFDSQFVSTPGFSRKFNY